MKYDFLSYLKLMSTNILFNWRNFIFN